MNEDRIQTSPSHINKNGFMCTPNIDSSPNHKLLATNIETVFQKDLSFSCENNIFSKSPLNFEKKSSDLKNAKLTCLKQEPSLSLSFPSKTSNYELVILRQPEEQHRARYLTEGSRGTVKDRTGQNHPTIKLLGYNKPATLQVFVGTDVGRIKPHGFYQACKVSHKNSTCCVERDIDGTTVLEMPIDPALEMTVVVDCVGILKLRNADVEQRIGIAKSKKKSTVARLVFRVNIPKSDSSFHTLQISSTPIVCTQPAGVPEILKKSLSQCSSKGGEEMFIIGKNFLKGTTVYFEKVVQDQVIWSKEAEIDQEFFQSTHLVCNVPCYQNVSIDRNVDVQIIVHSGGRISEPVPFTYTPCEDITINNKIVQDAVSLKRSYASSESEANSPKSEMTDLGKQLLSDLSPINQSTITTENIINTQTVATSPLIDPSVIILANDFSQKSQNLPTPNPFETQENESFSKNDLFSQEKIKLESSFEEDKVVKVEMLIKKEPDHPMIWPEPTPVNENSIDFTASFKVDPFSSNDSNIATTEETSTTKVFIKESGPMDTAEIGSIHEFNNDITQCILNEPLFPILLNSNIEDNNNQVNSLSTQSNSDEKKSKNFDLMINDIESPSHQFNCQEASISCNIQESLSELKNLTQQVGLNTELKEFSKTEAINKDQVDYNFIYQPSCQPQETPQKNEIINDLFINVFNDKKIDDANEQTSVSQILTFIANNPQFTNSSNINQSLDDSLNQQITPTFNQTIEQPITSPFTSSLISSFKQKTIVETVPNTLELSGNQQNVNFSIIDSSNFNILDQNHPSSTVMLENQNTKKLDLNKHNTNEENIDVSPMVMFMDATVEGKNATPITPRDQPTLLYQLLTTPNAKNSTSNLSQLPNLSADDVNRVLNMSQNSS